MQLELSNLILKVHAAAKTPYLAVMIIFYLNVPFKEKQCVWCAIWAGGITGLLRTNLVYAIRRY